jgi:SAM-dependent methyltransferase
MEFFDEAYQGRPPWDIGEAQPAVRELEGQGAIGASVLDVGCGTGENALFLAEQGHETWGIDLSPRAIVSAREKARRRGQAVVFQVADALELERLDRVFDSVLDCGMFHTLDDDERVRYARSLERVLRPGGSYFLLCFCERERGKEGPRRVTQDEIRDVFRRPGWGVRDIRLARFRSLARDGGAQAWLATIEREAASLGVRPTAWSSSLELPRLTRA